LLQEVCHLANKHKLVTCQALAEVFAKASKMLSAIGKNEEVDPETRRHIQFLRNGTVKATSG